jgi:formate dehydrogenase major subunit
MRSGNGKYERLTEPLVRDGGRLRPASWDEALDRAADGIRAAVESRGPTTFGLFSCSKATNEVNYLAQKFGRAVVGSNNIDSCNRT